MKETINGMLQYPNIGFSMIDVPYVLSGGEKLYLFNEANQVKAKADMLALNCFIDEASRLSSYVGPNRLGYKEFKFKQTDKNNNNFVFYKVLPLTPTGKKSKFPLIMHYYHELNSSDCINFGDDNIFGEIKYLENGAVGAAKIVQWYKYRLIVIAVAIRDKILCVSSVELVNGTGVRTKLYSK